MLLSNSFTFTKLTFVATLLTTRAEWFTSIGQMKDLLHHEVDLLASIKSYIIDEGARLKTLLQQYDSDKIPDTLLLGYYASEFTRLMDIKTAISPLKKTMKSMQFEYIDEYISHSVNQYHLIYRYVFVWRDLVYGINDLNFINGLGLHPSQFPSKEDIFGAAHGLLRIHVNKSVLALSGGLVEGDNAPKPLTREESFIIGKVAHMDRYYSACVDWMNAARLMKFKSQIADHSFASDEAVLKYIFNCSMGLHKDIEETDIDLITMQPDDYDTGSVLEAVQTRLYEMDDRRQGQTRRINKIFNRICMDDGSDTSVINESKLKCFYWTNHKHPRLILKPVKAEELWLSPYIIRFYNMVSDTEITEIKSEASYAMQNFSGTAMHYADCAMAILRYTDNVPADVKIRQRLADVTGLPISSATSPELLVANCGIGKYFSPHRNYKMWGMEANPSKRLARFVIDLSDVVHGGDTVFLNLGFRVKPVRGSALFWFNFDSMASKDKLILHATCPGLVSEKWTASRLVFENNEFTIEKCW